MQIQSNICLSVCLSVCAPAWPLEGELFLCLSPRRVGHLNGQPNLCLAKHAANVREPNFTCKSIEFNLKIHYIFKFFPLFSFSLPLHKSNQLSS